jgi:iron(III) transport system substrate-binding protein
MMMLALPPAARAQQSDWQKTWDQTLAAAKAEGKVVIIGQPSPAMRNEVIPAFTARYGIPVEYLSGPSSQLIGKVRTERESGIYSIDVFLTNGSTAINVQYAEKMLDPLKPLMLLPEITDGSKWKRGAPYYADPDKQYILILFTSVDSLMFINADQVKPEDLKSVDFLVDPKWRGKISSEDPQAAGGAGIHSAVHFYKQLGPEFLRKLYVDQKPVINRDRRQLTDWLARGTHPICLTCHMDDAKILIKEGFNLVEIFDLPGIPNRITPSPAVLSMANKAPHPNAARIFANWIASKEGLELYSRHAQVATLRNDVDESFLDPRVVPKPGVKYYDNTDLTWVADGQKQATKEVQELIRR